MVDEWPENWLYDEPEYEAADHELSLYCGQTKTISTNYWFTLMPERLNNIGRRAIWAALGTLDTK